MLKNSTHNKLVSFLGDGKNGNRKRILHEEIRAMLEQVQLSSLKFRNNRIRKFVIWLIVLILLFFSQYDLSALSFLFQD